MLSQRRNTIYEEGHWNIEVNEHRHVHEVSSMNSQETDSQPGNICTSFRNVNTKTSTWILYLL